MPLSVVFVCQRNTIFSCGHFVNSNKPLSVIFVPYKLSCSSFGKSFKYFNAPSVIAVFSRFKRVMFFKADSFGKIGQLVAHRMQAFGMNVIAYDPYLQPARAAQLGVQLVTLDELLKQSDFITIHLPKTKETVNLIGEEALKKVKPTVRIINAARGGVLDETALYNAIKEGRVAGAGLDVFA